MSAGGIASLRRLRVPSGPKVERCELCGVELTGRHRHLADTENRSLACACLACSMLFSNGSAQHGNRFRTIPDRYLTDPRGGVGEQLWGALDIPVGVAFLFHSAASDKPVVLYPGPAGATESELAPQAWESLLSSTPLASMLTPDTEALLIRCTREHQDCYLLPVDDCYALVGQLRLHWQGFDGGAEARAVLTAFFGELAQRARTPEELSS